MILAVVWVLVWVGFGLGGFGYRCMLLSGFSLGLGFLVGGYNTSLLCWVGCCACLFAVISLSVFGFIA